MTTAVATGGTLQAGVIYRLDEFRRITGWGLWALRTARRNGLKVIRTGGRGYIRGDDAIKYFDRLADAN